MLLLELSANGLANVGFNDGFVHFECLSISCIDHFINLTASHSFDLSHNL
jgi:hypothetical protein